MYKCIETFCGAGGMALGFKNAGFSLGYAFDFNERAVESFNHNVEPICEQRDAREVSVEELMAKAKVLPGELDLVSGGPPCQGFSKQKRGAHLFDDPRNLLMKEFIRIVSGLMPKTFVLENVAVFGQKRGEPYLRELSETLHAYNLHPHFYNAADYGLAQTRQRFILVGVRKDLGKTFEIPDPSHNKCWKTVGEVLSDLPEPPMDCTAHPDYPNHYRTKISKENEVRFSHVPQGGGWQDIPWDLRLKCHQTTDTKAGGWPDVYGRLEWDGQCPTITGGFDSFSRGRYGHPKMNRAITPREAARLQGFPDWYDFKGNKSEVRLQIGNAVPPPLSEVIGREIIRMLENEEGGDASPSRMMWQEELAV